MIYSVGCSTHVSCSIILDIDLVLQPLKHKECLEKTLQHCHMWQKSFIMFYNSTRTISINAQCKLMPINTDQNIIPLLIPISINLINSSQYLIGNNRHWEVFQINARILICIDRHWALIEGVQFYSFLCEGVEKFASRHWNSGLPIFTVWEQN